MPNPDHSPEQVIRETAYSIWEREGRPDGRAQDHWLRAIDRSAAAQDTAGEVMEDEEKVLAGRPDVNMPALLTRDVPGG